MRSVAEADSHIPTPSCRSCPEWLWPRRWCGHVLIRALALHLVGPFPLSRGHRGHWVGVEGRPPSAAPQKTAATRQARLRPAAPPDRGGGWAGQPQCLSAARGRGAPRGRGVRNKAGCGQQGWAALGKRPRCGHPNSRAPQGEEGVKPVRVKGEQWGVHRDEQWAPQV